VEIRSDVQCNEPLDAVRCLPEFTGVPETYASWRKAAIAAYKIYKPYDGSSRHYQAVIIIKSKIRGAADGVLGQFGTVMNFDAIINRLDFTYRDKRGIHVIEQEMSTVRQGSLTILQYYDEVEEKLTPFTNKVNMSYEPNMAQGLCTKFRNDALHVFVSGLKRSPTDVLFAAKPKNLPSALALAQEVKANHARYAFAANFAKGQEDRERKVTPRLQARHQDRVQQQGDPQPSGSKNPHFTKQQQQGQFEQQSGRWNKGGGSHEPMDVDPSVSKILQPSQAPAYVNSSAPQAYKRTATSGRLSGQRRQKVNHTAHEPDQDSGSYASSAAAAEQQIADDNGSGYDSDTLNFLGEAPCCPTSVGE